MRLPVAHAFGTLLDLPLDLPALLLLAGGALVGTAGWLSRRDARLQTPPPRRTWPASRRAAAAAAHPGIRRVGAAVGLVTLAALLILAVAGPAAAERNPLPRTLLVLVWGGLIPASLLLGRFYSAINPLRPLAAGLRALGNFAPRALPERLGRWPAAVLAGAVTVASQIALDSPAAVSAGLVLYVAVHVAGGARYGPAWFAACDPAEVVNDVVGGVAPLGRVDGAVGLRDPVVSAVRADTPPGTLATVAVLVGAAWTESIEDVVAMRGATLALATVAGCVLAWGVLRIAAVRPFLVPALLPLAGAYGLHLYGVPLLLEGQIALSQLSDPLGRAEALPGAVAGGVLLPVPAPWLALVLYLTFVGLHVLALVIGHRASLSRFDLRGARAVQFPLRTVLLASLLLGLWLPTLGA